VGWLIVKTPISESNLPAYAPTALMVRFADGDRAAFAPLFELLWPIVLRYCCRALGSGALCSGRDAEDAAQEALVKVFSRIADFDGTRDGLAWVLGIARYEVLTCRRQRQRSREHESPDLSWVHTGDASIEETVVEREMLAALEKAVANLSPRDLAVLESAWNGGMQPAEATERKRKQRAVARLHLAWRGIYGD
jgi:RNA polymerase sigma factor (sigma-70 family)